MASVKSMCILVMAIAVYGLCHGAELSSMNQLFKDLMVNYDNNIQPIKDPNGRIVINVTFSLKNIAKLDEKNQILSSFGFMAMTWTDELLTWDPLHYNHTYRVVMAAERIWVPEIVLYNGVNQGKDLALDAKYRAWVLYNGLVFFAPGYKWDTECRVNLKYFPYDKQSCNVTFINWVYTDGAVGFRAEGMELTNYEENDEWTLADVSVVNSTRAVDEAGSIRVPEVYFTVHLERKSMYYMVNVVVPCFIISLLSFLVFLMPSDAGEKISLAITVLLSYTVILLMVSDVTPKNGVTMPYITVFIIFSMAETAVTLIMTVIIMNFYHHPGNKPVPCCLRGPVFSCLASLLCMRDVIPTHSRVSVSPRKREPRQGEVLRNLAAHVQDLDHGGDVTKVSSSQHSLPDDVIKYIRDCIERDTEKEIEERYKSQWVALGKVMDRIMFTTFLCITIVVIIWFMIIVLYGQ